MSRPGKGLRGGSNETPGSTACARPRQFLCVSILRSYSPGGVLIAFAAAPTISGQHLALIVYGVDYQGI